MAQSPKIHTNLCQNDINAPERLKTRKTGNKETMPWGLYLDTEKKLLPEDIDAYRKIVANMRKHYKITSQVAFFNCQLLIDEIALSTLRIRHMETFLYYRNAEKDFDYTDKNYGEFEKVLISVKEQRKKALEALNILATGKNLRMKQKTEASYRDRMNRSRKLWQIETIEKTKNDANEAGNPPRLRPFGQEK